MNVGEHPNQIQMPRSGWKKTSIVMVLLVAAIGGLLYVVLRPKEPSYNGKPLSYWLKRCEEFGSASVDTKDPKVLECREAIRKIGTNGIPILLGMLRAKDSAFKLRLVDLIGRQNYIRIPFSPAEFQHYGALQGFFVLDDLAISAVPALVDISTNPPSPFSKQAADSALMAIYPASGAVIPYWVPTQKRAEWYNEAGQIKSQLGAHSNAIPAFSEAIKLNPTNAAAYLNRTFAKMELEDFAGALGDAKRTIELDSSNHSAFFASGACSFALKDFKSAEVDFTRAIDLHTNFVYGYNYRGLARANLRKLADALSDFDKATELEPHEATYYRNRAMVKQLQTEYELALEDVSKSIELDGRDAIAYAFRGRVKIALKEFELALLDFDKAIELDPRNPEGYSGRGSTRMLMNDFESASEDLEKALKLDPKSVSAYAARGWLKAKRGGEDTGALADFERALELSVQGQAPEVHAMLGVFQYKMSRWVSALENCRKALDLGVSEAADGVRFYVWLIRAQTGKEADANRELEAYLQSLQGIKTNEWDASVARFLSGSLSESNFLEQATTIVKRPSELSGQVCDSFYYAGMKRKLAGDLDGATELFQKCLDTKENNYFGYLNAISEMRALENK